MDNLQFHDIQKKPVFRTIMFFLIILCVAVILITLGRRNDAVTKAQIYHAGVLTADKVNTAFDKVSGTLTRRYVKESDEVKKGDLLMEIDDRDLNFTIDNLQAQLDSLDAQIKQQEADIKLSKEKLITQEQQLWYQIEELDASLQGAIALYEQSKAEYERYSSLKETLSVSKSAYDSARRTYLQAESTRLSIIKNLQELTLGATPEQIEKLKTLHSAKGMTLNTIVESRTEIENMTNTLNALKASAEALKAQLGQEQLNRERTKLYAPADGRILEVNFEEGEQIPSGSTAVLLETSNYYYDIYLSEYAAVRYKPGDRIKGFIPALDDFVEGTIRFVHAAPSFADMRMTREQGQADLTSYKVRIYPDAKENLRSGMTVEIADE